jgi:hypothetical protein
MRTTAMTPASATAPWSSTTATLAPWVGGCNTSAVSIPGTFTSIV